MFVRSAESAKPAKCVFKLRLPIHYSAVLVSERTCGSIVYQASGIEACNVVCLFCLGSVWAAWKTVNRPHECSREVLPWNELAINKNSEMN